MTDVLKNQPTSHSRSVDYKYFDLTPVQQYGNFFFKREDLYQPFMDFGISGSKVRQCLRLIERNLGDIREFHGGTISTAASVHSPQAVIVSRVAQEFGLRCIVGHASKDPLKHKAMRLCMEYGAELVKLAGTGFNNVLYSRLNERPDKGFVVNFGYESKERNIELLGPVATQVQNLPDDLDMLVIPMGSGVTAQAIVHGLHCHKPHLLPKTHLVQPFGYDRTSVVSNGWEEYEALPWHPHCGNYPYKESMGVYVDGVGLLDGIYEAKAFDYMMKNMVKSSDQKVCFWIIGNSNVLRT